VSAFHLLARPERLLQRIPGLQIAEPRPDEGTPLAGLDMLEPEDLEDPFANLDGQAVL